MATVFSVIGYREDDPDRLLMIGDDGVHYEYDLPRDITKEVAVDENWQFDPGTIAPDYAPLDVS